MSTGEVLAVVPPARAWWLRYAVAVVSVVLGWLAREVLTPLVGPTALPFIFFFPAVAASAWYGGVGPAVLSIGLAAVAANWFFLEPAHSLAIRTSYDVAALAAFLLANLFLVGAIGMMHRAIERLHHELAERDRIRTELAHARDLLATTLTSIGDGVIVTDSGGRVTFLNAEAERLTQWKSAEAAGRPLPDVFRIINEDTLVPAENPVEKVLRCGKVIGLANHTLLIAKHGAQTPIDDSAAPIHQSGGPIVGVVLVFRNVAERRSADDARVRLAAIVESSGDAILTKDLTGVIRSWNTGAERLFGYRADEIIGKSITTLIPSDLLDDEKQILDRLVSGQPWEQLETFRLASDGRRIPVSITVSPLRDRDGRVVGASKIIRDVTNIVTAREALAQEKELLVTTLASIGDAVIVTDAKGRVTFCNAEAERLTGWRLSEALGRDLPTVFHIVNEQTRTPADNPVERVLCSGNVVGLANHTILLGEDGTETPIDDSAAPIRDKARGILGVVLVFRDITARRHAERTIEEADRRKDEFLAILSHELRNPLAPIRMAVALLGKIGPVDPKLHDLRDVIDRQTGQLARLLDDLLDVSRIASGKIVLRKERVSVGLAVSSAVESMRPVIESHGHELTVNMAPQQIYVEGDLARLSQVFANLLSNAAKYTDKGGRISLTVEHEHGAAIVRVRDSGIGIPAHHLTHIFEMFVQVDQSLERTRSGLGVGLSLARRLVELHGGRIVACSDGPGKGSEFIIRLPSLIEPALPPAPAQAATTHGVARPRCRILVADDNVDSGTLLAKVLAHQGHNVRVVHEGTEALEAAAAFHPDWAILDIGMPHLNGYEVARCIRFEFGNRITLVALTGWGQQEDKRRAFEAGFDHHLTKPIDPEALLRLLDEDPRAALREAESGPPAPNDGAACRSAEERSANAEEQA